MFAGERPGYIYSRISNPTLDLLERRIAVLEGAEAGLALASGMGAITAALWTLLSPGDEVIVDKTLYGCTFAFMHHGLSRFGITITHVDMTDPANLAPVISRKDSCRLFRNAGQSEHAAGGYRGHLQIAHSSGATVVVDNTYATPYLTRPIELGADMVLHSATKYLGGHGDVVAGLMVGSAEQVAEIRMFGMKDMTGAVMAPFNAMLILRGLKTLALQDGTALRQRATGGRHAGGERRRGKGSLSGSRKLRAARACAQADARLRRDDRLRTQRRHRCRPAADEPANDDRTRSLAWRRGIPHSASCKHDAFDLYRRRAGRARHFRRADPAVRRA
jgi:hypothetical protein